MTHSIDALDNDLDDIKALRKKITKISPEEDVGQVSIKADLDALASLTTDSGKAILSLETWLTALYARGKKLRALVKSGSADFTPEEVGEVKFQISSAKLVSLSTAFHVQKWGLGLSFPSGPGLCGRDGADPR